MFQSRHLAAIMFADIVGYTAIMQKNEKEALKLLNRFKELIEEYTPIHEGTIVQYFGDGCVLTFDSSTECVNCAMDIQRGCNAEFKVPVRIGMHLGEVIFHNNNIFGDGVNIASRIESLGVPGGILMSKSIRDQIKNKGEFRLASLGGFAFKNVEEPMEVFALANEGLRVPKRADLKGKLSTSDPELTHRLAAIMFSNIVGYAVLNRSDSLKAKAIQEKNKSIQKPIIERYGGTLLTEADDDILVSFRSASDAVLCAKDIIKAIAAEVELSLRIGINIGDLVNNKGVISGDGVEIAAGIQSLAPINGILISQGVNMNVASQPGINTRFLGEEQLRNTKQLIKVFLVEVEGVEAPVIVPDPNPENLTDREPSKGATRKALHQMKLGIFAIAAVVLLGIGYVFIDNNKKQTPVVSAPEVLDKSIAVLPFENLSADAENQYFADGQTEAILNHLTKIAELRVISRTTMMGYAGTNKSVPVIASELGVRYVLEGSVQKFGQKVRINAQLIDSNLDRHLWSENYDRDLNDIFTIQTEIAKNVAEELEANISSGEQEVLETIPTTNLNAYDFYLKGQDYLFRSRKEEDYRYAIQMFQRAVEIDESYTLAWVGLSAASRWIFWFHQDRSSEHQRQTKKYLDKAISLDPDLMEVQLETAVYYYHCELNYQRALQILNRLKDEYPKNDQLYLMVGAVHRRMGQFEKSLELMERAISLSPNMWNHWLDAGGTLNLLRRYDEAAQHFENAINLNPSEGLCYVFMGLLHMVQGNADQARLLMADNKQLDHPGMIWLWSETEIFQRNYQEAAGILLSTDHTVWDHQFGYMPKALLLGHIYRLKGDESLAIIHFREARRLIEKKLKELEDDARLYSSLGLAYAGIGMEQEAIANGNKALSIMNTSIDAWQGFYNELDMAKILVMLGKHQEAIEKLTFLFEQNGYLSVELLNNDPFWDPLREIAGFLQLTSNSPQTGVKEASR
jgi:class 3 adenylate cyclase/TolB-like protein/Flp pilus assembly protein TadD